MADVPSAPLHQCLTLSVVSHAHGPLLLQMLADLNALPRMAGTKVVVTLNVASESFDPRPYGSLRVVTVRNPHPRGFGANHNAAFSACETPWFVVLNPDLRFTQADCFERLLAAADTRPEHALLAPVITNPTGAVEDSIRANLTLRSVLRRRLLGAPEAAPAQACATGPDRQFHWLAGMFLMVRAAAFKAVDGFDERYFLYCEDYDLCARLFNAGHSLAQVQTARALHDAQRDSHRSLGHLKLHLSSLAKVWTSSAFWRVWWHDVRMR